LKTSAKLSSPAQNAAEAIYVADLARLLPGERLQVYCLADNPQPVSVTLNSSDENGKSLASVQESFVRSMTTEEQSPSAFVILLGVVGGGIFIAIA